MIDHRSEQPTEIEHVTEKIIFFLWEFPAKCRMGENL